MVGIYKITSPSKRVYIGRSIDIKKRWRSYKLLHCKKQRLLYNSFIKYGVDKHSFEIIHICESDKLNELERYYVDLYQCFNSRYGLNLREGGGSHSLMTKRTPDQIKRISEAHKGQRAHNKGVKMKSEQYDKCKISMYKKGCVGNRSGVKLTEEHKVKLSIAHTGKKLTEEHKMKISGKMKIAMIGNKNGKRKTIAFNR